MRRVAILLTALSAGACATMTEGTTQQIVVQTTPSGADCVLTRDGQTLGRINPTPGTVLVTKTKDDIIVKCVKEGYAEAVYLNDSGLAATAAANVGSFIFLSMLGGGVGAIVDSASGADNKYDSPMTIPLRTVEEAAAAAAAAPPGQDAFDVWLLTNRRDLAQKLEHYLKYSSTVDAPSTSLQLQQISEIRYIERRPEGYVVSISYEMSSASSSSSASSEGTQTVLIKVVNDKITDIQPA